MKGIDRNWMLTWTMYGQWLPGDPDPEDWLRDLKAYGSRTLNWNFGNTMSGTGWTQAGSKRKLPDGMAIRNAVQYLRDQEYPMVIWIKPIIESLK